MPDTKPFLQLAFNAFDTLNSQDPNTEEVAGTLRPKESLYAERMTHRLNVFAPNAIEALQLAARCQHIERWTILRTDFPEGLQGYNQWRGTLSKFHAQRAFDILLGIGYDESTCKRVSELLQKKRLKLDPEAQTLEDVICLVFLEHYLNRFAEKHDEAKLIDIIRKTWKKMSTEGHTAALSLNLTDSLQNLVGKALSQ